MRTEERQIISWWITCFIIAILLFLLSSCGPASKLRRAKRLIAQAEASGLEWKSDTVFREVKVVVPETKFDTVVQIVNWTDTVTVTKDRVTTRVVVTPSTKTVYIESKCDSVIVEKRVPYTVTREIKVGDSWWKNFGQTTTAFVVGLVLGFIASKLFKF